MMRDNMKFVVKSIPLFITMFLGAFILTTLWPFAMIWAVNEWFNLSIPYTFNTWLAGFIIRHTIIGTKLMKHKPEDKK